jgi:DNA-binding IclR family transcriptional regulator
VGEALPVMRSIVDTINETTQLAVLDGIENVYLAAAGVVGRERRTFLPPECGARS